MNPHTKQPTEIQNTHPIKLETAKVITANDNDGSTDGGHIVEIEPDFIEGTDFAEVIVNHDGDISIPTQGDRVIVAYLRDTTPVVIGTRYKEDDNLPAYTAGERIVSHPLSDSRVYFKADGSLLVESDSGATIELQSNGDIVLNGGSNNPITSISTTTDADGHVTDVSTTKSSDIFVP